MTDNDSILSRFKRPGVRFSDEQKAQVKAYVEGKAMKVIVVLSFKEFKNVPTQSLLVRASAWKSDLGRRMVLEDIQDMLGEALDHTLALMEQGDNLTVTFESSGK